MNRIGHNNGPTLQKGASWRTHCWQRARAELLPRLPIEILRGRVKRAKELGLEYKTYASVRAATGHDVVGFLFSSNALRAFLRQPKVPVDRVLKLQKIVDCHRIALVSEPLSIRAFANANDAIEFAVAPAPKSHATWSATRIAIHQSLYPQRTPADRFVLIGDTALEREWSVAGRLAAYLPADRYFPEQI